MGDVPNNEGDLIQSVLQDKEARFNSADLNIAYRMKVSTSRPILALKVDGKHGRTSKGCEWFIQGTDVISASMRWVVTTTCTMAVQVDEYQRLCEYSENLEENWGKPPGNLNSNGQELLVFGKQFGNVFIGVQVCKSLTTVQVLGSNFCQAIPVHQLVAYWSILVSAHVTLLQSLPSVRQLTFQSALTFSCLQPTFGYEGDPMRLLFSKSASPHHGFAAFYTYLEKIFKADAVLHFGTHGSLEFMPGKQVRVLTCVPLC